MYNSPPSCIINDIVGDLDWFRKKIVEMFEPVVKSTFDHFKRLYTCCGSAEGKLVLRLYNLIF